MATMGLASQPLLAKNLKLSSRRTPAAERNPFMKEPCPACNEKSMGLEIRPSIKTDTEQVDCPICGKFTITWEAKSELRDRRSDLRHLLSGWIREQSIRGRPPIICSSDYERKPDEAGRFMLSEILDELVPQTVSATMERSLLNLARISKEPGLRLELREVERSICFARSGSQMLYYLQAMDTAGWLLDYSPIIPDAAAFVLSPQAWQHISVLQSSQTESKQGFVAMSFATELDSAWHLGIFPGVTDSGFSPLRLYENEHNEKICDRIVAEIRKSRFLIADVTLQRPSVYYEAGFAQGLGRSVIWSCREDDLKNCHFDTRQYAHIVWRDPVELRERVRRRIEATII